MWYDGSSTQDKVLPHPIMLDTSSIFRVDGIVAVVTGGATGTFFLFITLKYTSKTYHQNSYRLFL